eukprot:1539931-Pyramimonas_sp.AAC.1
MRSVPLREVRQLIRVEALGWGSIGCVFWFFQYLWNSLHPSPHFIRPQTNAARLSQDHAGCERPDVVSASALRLLTPAHDIRHSGRAPRGH